MVHGENEVLFNLCSLLLLNSISAVQVSVLLLLCLLSQIINSVGVFVPVMEPGSVQLVHGVLFRKFQFVTVLVSYPQYAYIIFLCCYVFFFFRSICPVYLSMC